MTQQELLQRELGQRIAFRERRVGLTQVLAPIFHEDGDMIDLFIDERAMRPGIVRLTDAGLTLMKLSYSFELDTPNKRRLFEKIISENFVGFEDGEIFLEGRPSQIALNFLQLSQVIAKVSSLQYLKRQVVSSLFYEELDRFISDKLLKFGAVPRVSPLKDRPELEIDWGFSLPRPIFLFGVKDSSKARLSAISCLEFQHREVPFRSVIVHENFDSLPKKDKMILTNAADKQFVSLQDFMQDGEAFFKRETAA